MICTERQLKPNTASAHAAYYQAFPLKACVHIAGRCDAQDTDNASPANILAETSTVSVGSNEPLWGRSSLVERSVHIGNVAGSIPAAPTNLLKFKRLREALTGMQDASTLALALVPDENSPVNEFLTAIHRHCATSLSQGHGGDFERKENGNG